MPRHYPAELRRQTCERMLAGEGGIVKSCGSARPADHAATSSCFATVSTNTPFLNFAPARTRATSAAPLT